MTDPRPEPGRLEPGWPERERSRVPRSTDPGTARPTSRRSRTRTATVRVALAAAVLVGGSACTGALEDEAPAGAGGAVGEAGAGASNGVDGAAAGKGADESVPEPDPVPAAPSPEPSPEPVTLAFAGDVHAEGGSADALRAGLPTVRDVLGRADLTVVNLETAVTDRGTPANKQFVFRASPSLLPPLKDAGVDVVSLANNHGLDFGQQGLTDTLAAAEAAQLPLVGLGQDEDAAYAPHVATVKGQRIAVLGATQVLDSQYIDSWTAQDGQPGMASAKRADRLVEEVRRARESADIVVVYLHWGQERNACPLPRQQELAQQLADAGADVVVGGHAHVLLGGGMLGDAYVDYGLGNFVFSGSRSAETLRSGVLTLTLQGRDVEASEWTPAVIRGGVPHLLEGAQKEQAVADKERRRDCTGLAPVTG